MVGGGEHNDIGQEVLGMTTGRRPQEIRRHGVGGDKG